MYYNGIATMCETGEQKPDYEKAIEIYQKAAYNGHASSQYNLGITHYIIDIHTY